MDNRKSILVRLSAEEFERVERLAVATRRTVNAMVLVALDEAYTREFGAIEVVIPQPAQPCGEGKE